MNRQILVLLMNMALTLSTVFAVGCGQRKPAAGASASASPSLTVVTVTSVLSREVNRQLRLPGELQPYQDVMLYPKVPGFVEWIGVDRGSLVRAGQLLARLTAPEIGSQRSEAESKVMGIRAQKVEAEARLSSVRAQRAEAEARLAASNSTYNRLKAASVTPGVVSGNEVENAQRQVQAELARVQAFKDSESAASAQVAVIAENEVGARSAAKSVNAAENYLRIVAPFEGVVTERNAHKGSLAGPSGAAATQCVLRVQQVSRLRLVVSVPEAEIASVKAGTKVNFSVPTFPGETFTGIVTRISHSLDVRTRTMAIELDVNNPSRRLSPGMFPQVSWPSSRQRPSLLVPPSSVAVTSERTFVIRVRDGVTEWVDVKRGASIQHEGTDLIEVFGDLDPGDQISLRGTDELRNGTRVLAKPAPQPQGKS